MLNLRVFGMINPRHFERLLIQWCDEMSSMPLSSILQTWI